MNQFIKNLLFATIIDQTDYFAKDYETNKRRFESRYDAHWTSTVTSPPIGNCST